MIDTKSRDQEIIFYNLTSKLHDQLGQIKKNTYCCSSSEELYRLLLTHKNDKAKSDDVTNRNCSIDITDVGTKEENKEI